MDNQNEQALEELTIPHPMETDLMDNEIDFLSFYQSYFNSLEIRSSVFYILQSIIMFIICFISCLVPIQFDETDNNSNSFFNKMVSFFYISPYSFDNTYFVYIVIGIILFLILFLIGYTFFIGCKIREDTPINSNSFKPWVVLHRLVLPFPGYIIGCYLGFYLTELTRKIYLGQLFLIIFTGMFWCWSVVTSSLLYNGLPYKRKSDIFQIHHSHVSFECFISILPMIQAIIPPSLSILIQSSIKADIYFFTTLLTSLLCLLFAVFNKPYINDSSSQVIIAILLIRIPVSYMWKVELCYSDHIYGYFIFCLVFSVFSFVLVKFISSHCNCHVSVHQSTPSSHQIQQSNDSEISMLYNDQHDSDQLSQNSQFDPFLNSFYPLNLVSLTYQDLVMALYLALSTVLMSLLNAAAARRMPISKPLPDLIQDHFHLTELLRESKTNGTFQFSNVIILIQVPLLIIFLLFKPKYLNLRRFGYVYATICNIRAISFLITSLPAPCAGYPNCPCADPEVIKSISNANPVKVGLSWLFGLGIFLAHPQCGDLIISGHTIWLWMVTLTLVSVIKYVIPKPFNWLVSGFLCVMTIITFFYIILARNHYSIDVWFGFVITQLLWSMYNNLATLAINPPSLNDTLLVRIVRWIETRSPKRELLQTRRMRLQQSS